MTKHVIKNLSLNTDKIKIYNNKIFISIYFFNIFLQ